MIDARNAVDIRTKILDYSQNVSYYNPRGLEILETHGTSHIVAADEDGMAITLTTTVNLLFGSLLVVPETGVIMNNEMYGPGRPYYELRLTALGTTSLFRENRTSLDSFRLRSTSFGQGSDPCRASLRQSWRGRMAPCTS